MSGTNWAREIREAAQRAENNPPTGEQISIGETLQASGDQSREPLAIPPMKGSAGHQSRDEAGKRGQPPFTGRDQSRNYRRFYRVVFDFHERHAPPRNDDAYWSAVCDDMSRIAADNGNDPFLTEGLLWIFAELEREVKAEMGRE